MKKSPETFIGKFRVFSIKPNADGTTSCDLIGVDDKNLKITLGEVHPIGILKVAFVNAWMDGKEMALELVMQDGTIVTAGIQQDAEG